jgi:hypothetical protein
MRTPYKACCRTINDESVAARLPWRPEQRHVGLAGNVLFGRLPNGARNDVALEIDRHKARVRTIVGDGEQIGVAAVLRDGLGEVSGKWRRLCNFSRFSVISKRTYRRMRNRSVRSSSSNARAMLPSRSATGGILAGTVDGDNHSAGVSGTIRCQKSGHVGYFTGIGCAPERQVFC